MERGAFYDALAPGPNRLKGFVIQFSSAPGDAASRIRENALTGGTFSGLSDPKVDDWMKQYDSSVDLAQRKTLLEQVQTYLLDQYLMIPVCRSVMVTGFGPRLVDILLAYHVVGAQSFHSLQVPAGPRILGQSAPELGLRPGDLLRSGPALQIPELRFRSRHPGLPLVDVVRHGGRDQGCDRVSGMYLVAFRHPDPADSAIDPGDDVRFLDFDNAFRGDLSGSLYAAGGGKRQQQNPGSSVHPHSSVSSCVPAGRHLLRGSMGNAPRYRHPAPGWVVISRSMDIAREAIHQVGLAQVANCRS
jgi:hypothetical protein